MSTPEKTRIITRSEQAQTVRVDTRSIPIQDAFITEDAESGMPAQPTNGSPAFGSTSTVIIQRSTQAAPKAAPAPANDYRRDDSPTTLLRTSSGTTPHATQVMPPESFAPESAPAEGHDEAGTDLPVGWIVAITGPMKGQAFALGCGQNIIGRSSTGGNRIVLKGDCGISRMGHLVITYDPLNNRFSVRPGTQCSGIVYLNGELLEIPCKLKRGDSLRLSQDTTFRFIPLCDEDFTWE